MSTANVTQFAQAITREPKLQEELRTAAASAPNGDTAGAIAASAQAHGYEVTSEEVKKAGLVEALTELDLKQLEAVAGGVYPYQNDHSPFDD